MKVAKLSPQARKKIRAWRYDRIIEKHEGPFDWDKEFKWGQFEFMNIEGHQVLLPVEKEDHPNITIIRCIPSADGHSLTIFLKDMTNVPDQSCAFRMAGYVAICDKVPGEPFFVAILYHEWFMVDNTSPNKAVKGKAKKLV